MIRAFIFDFFDVIHKDHQKAWLAANGYKREGGFAEASDLLDQGLIDFQEYLERYAKLSDRTPSTVVKEFQAFAKVDQAIVELIERLHERYQTGLISNAHTNELQPILTEHKLHRLFDEICISSEVGIAKPDPAIFLHMSGRLGVEPSECVFTDDNTANVMAAEQVGMRGVVFTELADLTRILDELGI